MTTVEDTTDAQRVAMARCAYDQVPGSLAGTYVTEDDTYQLVPARLLAALGDALYGPFPDEDAE